MKSMFHQAFEPQGGRYIYFSGYGPEVGSQVPGNDVERLKTEFQSMEVPDGDLENVIRNNIDQAMEEGGGRLNTGERNPAEHGKGMTAEQYILHNIESRLESSEKNLENLDDRSKVRRSKRKVGLLRSLRDKFKEFMRAVDIRDAEKARVKAETVNKMKKLSKETKKDVVKLEPKEKPEVAETGESYIVKRGDTLGQIVKNLTGRLSWGMAVDYRSSKVRNKPTKLADANLIYPGQHVWIENGTVVVSDAPQSGGKGSEVSSASVEVKLATEQPAPKSKLESLDSAKESLKKDTTEKAPEALDLEQKQIWAKRLIGIALAKISQSLDKETIRKKSKDYSFVPDGGHIAITIKAGQNSTKEVLTDGMVKEEWSKLKGIDKADILLIMNQFWAKMKKGKVENVPQVVKKASKDEVSVKKVEEVKKKLPVLDKTQKEKGDAVLSDPEKAEVKKVVDLVRVLLNSGKKNRELWRGIERTESPFFVDGNGLVIKLGNERTMKLPGGNESGKFLPLAAKDLNAMWRKEYLPKFKPVVPPLAVASTASGIKPKEKAEAGSGIGEVAAVSAPKSPEAAPAKESKSISNSFNTFLGKLGVRNLKTEATTALVAPAPAAETTSKMTDMEKRFEALSSPEKEVIRGVIQKAKGIKENYHMNDIDWGNADGVFLLKGAHIELADTSIFRNETLYKRSEIPSGYTAESILPLLQKNVDLIRYYVEHSDEELSK